MTIVNFGFVLYEILNAIKLLAVKYYKRIANWFSNILRPASEEFEPEIKEEKKAEEPPV